MNLRVCQHLLGAAAGRCFKCEAPGFTPGYAALLGRGCLLLGVEPCEDCRKPL